jgi:hypothetical protein
MTEGGVQVATVKASMNFKMKNLGKVPPRLETLREMLAFDYEDKCWRVGLTLQARSCKYRRRQDPRSSRGTH